MKFCPNCGSQNLENIGINNDGVINKCLLCKMQFSIRVNREPSSRISYANPRKEREND